MTIASDVIAECERRDIFIKLGARSSELSFDAPVGAMAPELRALIAAHKTEIIELIFECEERAALSGCPEWHDARLWLRALDNPTVQRVLQIFGGEIVEVRGVESAPKAVGDRLTRDE